MLGIGSWIVVSPKVWLLGSLTVGGSDNICFLKVQYYSNYTYWFFLAMIVYLCHCLLMPCSSLASCLTFDKCVLKHAVLKIIVWCHKGQWVISGSSDDLPVHEMLSALKESKMKTLRVGNGYNLGPSYTAINFNYPQSSLTTDSELPCFTLCLCCILHKKT